MNKPLDLSQFREIPTHPAYRVRRDGRVYSLKSEHILSEHRTKNPHGWRVRLGNTELRIRDLVWTIWGDASDFNERARDWAYASSAREILSDDLLEQVAA